MRTIPKQNRAHTRVSEILDAARRVLINQGLEKFTTNHVAEEAKCNIGTLYRYFPEKNGLLECLYEAWLEEEKCLNIAFLKEARLPVDPATFVTDLFHRHLEVHNEADHKLGIELTKALYLKPGIKSIDRQYEEQLVAITAQNLSQYTKHTFEIKQIRYIQKLAVSLLEMINNSDQADRGLLSEMAEETIRNTILGWYD